MKRVLLIDDDPLIRRAIGKVLETAGYEVDVAAEGGAGLRLAEARPPDVVVVDMFMPGKEGLETIRALQRLFASVPIVAMTGGEVEGLDVLDVARLLGARMQLRKPFGGDALLAAVKASLGAD